MLLLWEIDSTECIFPVCANLIPYLHLLTIMFVTILSIYSFIFANLSQYSETVSKTPQNMHVCSSCNFFKARLSLSNKKFFTLMKALLKWWKMLYISSWKLFSFSRYLNFCLYFLVIWEKRLDYKDKGNFKIYVVKAWLIKLYNTHIAQYLTK